MIMLIDYDFEKANKILDDFYNATGIKMVLLKTDFTPLTDRFHWEKNTYCKSVQNTKNGEIMCYKSDNCILKQCSETKKTVPHICHAGLYDVSVPIIFEDNVIGYIMFGQIRSDLPFSKVKDHIVALGLNEIEAEKLFYEIPCFDLDKIKSISSIAEIIAKHILLEKALVLKSDERLSEIDNYIDTKETDMKNSIWKEAEAFLNDIIPPGWRFGAFANNGLDYVFVKENKTQDN